MNRKVMLAMPSYEGKARVETLMALIHETKIMMMSDIDMEMKISASDSILPRARNQFLGDFYHREDCTDLVFLDDDIWWQPGALTRLLKHPVDFVCGIYPKRSDPIEFPFDLETGEDISGPGGLIKVQRGPGGFLRLTKKCVSAMYDRYLGLRYHEPALEGKMCCALFDFALVGGHYVGEDMVFFERWREMGGTCWADPDITFKHVGFKRYEANLLETMTSSDKVVKLGHKGQYRVEVGGNDDGGIRDDDMQPSAEPAGR